MPVQGRLKGLKVLHNSEMLKINEKFQNSFRVPPAHFYYTTLCGIARVELTIVIL